MRRITCVLDTDSGPYLIHTDVLDSELTGHPPAMEYARLCPAFEVIVNVSETRILYLHVCNLRTRVNFGVLTELLVPVFLGTKHIGRVVKSIHPTEKFNVPYLSPLLAVTIIYEALCKAGTSNLDIHQDSSDEGN